MVEPEVVATVIEEDGSNITFAVNADGEEIGEIDVELESSPPFISGISRGESINNGCLAQAQIAVAACLTQHRFEKGQPPLEQLLDLDERPLFNSV